MESELSDGLTKNSFKPGDPVIMTVHAAKDGSPHSVAYEVQKGDGTILCGPCVGNKGPGASARNKNNNNKDY